MRTATHHGDTSTSNGQGEELVSHLRARMAPVDHWLRALARDRPFVALAGAVGVGYLLGRLIRRR